MEYKNLMIIGTSHIAEESIEEVTSKFAKVNPDMIALELDRRRLVALFSKKTGKEHISIKNIAKVGIKGYLFSLLGHWIETKLGSVVGVKPGADMLTAYRLAVKNKKEVHLIDQDIELTLKKLSKAISWKERWNFLVDLFNGFVLRKKEIEGFDLTKVPSRKLIAKMIKSIKKKYPNIYHVLVTERNETMSRNLAVLMKRNMDKRILAIVGAGHEKDMIALIKKKYPKIEVIGKQSTPGISFSYTIG